MESVGNVKGIYCIYCKDSNIPNIYIGSTNNLNKRITEHKQNYKNELRHHYKFKVYRFIRENGGFENWRFTLLERTYTDDKNDLRKLEQMYLDMFEEDLLLNNCRAFGHNQKQYMKEYTEKNKEKIRKQKKEYYLRNKEKIDKRQNEKKHCPKCSKLICKSNIRRHLKVCPENC